MTPFPRNSIIICNAINERSPPYYFCALRTPFPVIAFMNEEATGCINKEAIGTINEVASGVFRGFHMLVYWFGYPNYLPKLKEN